MIIPMRRKRWEWQPVSSLSRSCLGIQSLLELWTLSNQGICWLEHILAHAVSRNKDSNSLSSELSSSTKIRRFRRAIMAVKENNSVQRFVFLNQLTKPLFRELCIDVAQHLPMPSLVSTGDKETLAKESWSPHLKIRSSPSYNRNSKWSRLFSWLSYTFDSLFVVGRAGPTTNSESNV